jgi:ADP-ribosylglycohydrolase
MTDDALIGCLLGTAVGDALGLPYEGMTAGRGKRMYPDTERHHFLVGGFGMVSDDTEHACFTAQAIIRSGGDPERFERELAGSLRWWLLGLPAGVGFATLRSILRLWLGISPARSGVFSAGNGPAMRAPVLGTAFGYDPARLREYVLRSTRLTHSDPKAYLGSLAAAVAAHVSACGSEVEPLDFLRVLRPYLTGEGSDECMRIMTEACISAGRGESTAVYAAGIGCGKGISGYIYHTVPCVIQAWLRHQRDYAGGVREIIEAGGDTDTTAAILGGIIGAGVGKEGIPERWRSGVIEWPRSMSWMEQLGASLSNALKDHRASNAPACFVPAIIPRNLLFLLVVLGHGFRRLLPPY